MLPLSKLREGRSGVVRRFDGGHGLARRLAEMGVSAGTTLRVIKSGGPVIVEVKGHRLVIGHGMVGRIIVEPET